MCAISMLALQLPPTTWQWEYVYDYYWSFGILAGFITFGLMIYIVIKYRARGKETPVEKQREDRETWKGPLIVIALMSIVLILVAIQTINALNFYQNIPQGSNSLHVSVVAHQFYFEFDYPNGKVSQGELVVPVNHTIVLNVTSADVYHQLGIPFFRVKTDAIPGRFNVVWIEPVSTGNYTIQCFELCGVGHATMINKLVVLTEQGFSLWYNATQRG